MSTSLNQPADQQGIFEQHDGPPQSQDSSQLSQPSCPVPMDFSDPLPPLHTPHHHRKIILCIGLVLITLDLCCLPITYYYALKFGTSLPLQDIFAVITSVYGLISFSHYGLRSLKLFRKKTAFRWRPVGWTKWGMLEFFQVNTLIAISLVELELIIGTIPTNPIIRLCAMPSPTLSFYFGCLLTYSAIATQMKWKLPFNMSSTPKGSNWRPALLAFVEDTGGIEGQGGILFRTNVMRRYEVSPIFRRMILIVTWVWGIGFLCIAIIATVVIMTLSPDIGFGVGWGLPYAWALIWTFLTMMFVNRELKKEKIHWMNKRPAQGPTMEPVPEPALEQLV